MNQHARITVNKVYNSIHALQYAPDMLQPLGILCTGYELTVHIQAVAHRVDILDIQERNLTRHVVLLVLVAAASRAVGQGVYVRTCVHDVQALVSLVQVGDVLEIHLVPEAALARHTAQRLGTAQYGHIAVFVFDPG